MGENECHPFSYKWQWDINYIISQRAKTPTHAEKNKLEKTYTKCCATSFFVLAGSELLYSTEIKDAWLCF